MSEYIGVVDVLTQDAEKFHLEFFLGSDRKRGLTNHQPLTLIAMAHLLNHDHQLTPSHINTFEKVYASFLAKFQTGLIPPLKTDVPSESLPSVKASREEFLEWTKGLRMSGSDGLPKLTTAFVARFNEHGVQQTLDDLLGLAADEKGLLAGFFHGFLLVVFAIEVLDSPLCSSPPPALISILASGLAIMVARAPEDPPLPEGQPQLWEQPRLQDGGPSLTLQERVDNLLADPGSDALFQIIQPKLVTPVFPIGIVGVFRNTESTPEAVQQWQALSSKHITLHSSDLKAPYSNFAEFSLRYFAKTKGCFSALHIVSASFGLTRLATASPSFRPSQGTLDALALALWRFSSFLILMLEKSAFAEKVTVPGRARGSLSPTDEELVAPQGDNLDGWDRICERALSCYHSHTIKMVFAAKRLDEMVGDEKNKIHQLARLASHYACLHEIG
eukprot:CAMPEP_0201489214 /NCGR_PEP_ID=MMETSP0151_2-20130828/21310_1 /ASSEMBLY_ACC=CAM_ASM_000257 /TAXON_ID=200890 /ORGANISM="Paramoeba atlantica, Strain 621/1 / CCAP 1560/9" /LENGTH=444 /DNA_ID=CAMNT_0047874727 /DNA_START=20 /DNA_END=1354 /DNA_ORIENTATION=-